MKVHGFESHPRTSAQNLQQIKQLLHKLDVAPRNLQVTVIQNVDSQIIEQLRALSGKISTGQSHIHAQFSTLHAQLADYQNQSLQVLDGHRAWIAAGEDIPIKQRQVIHNRHSVRVIDSTSFQQKRSGFYVLPRVVADKVLVDIYAQHDASQHIQQAQSTLSGPLGTWLLLTDGEQTEQNSQNTLGSSHQQQKNQFRNILIKVEEQR